MTKAIKETIFNDCPIRNVLARISDKWSLLVMYALNHNGAKATRFGELRKLIPDISQKMLTSTLAHSRPTVMSHGRCLLKFRHGWNIHLRSVPSR